MAIEVDIDVLLLKSEIRKTYACVSDEPDRDFIFPTGRAWAEDLGSPMFRRVPWSRLRASPTPGSSAGSLRASASSTSVPVPGPDRRSAPAGRR
jgi:hypothetical protein